MSILLSHPTGNANVRNALCALQAAGLLTAFQTTVATFDGSRFDYLSKLPGGSPLQRRRYPESIRSLTHQHPLRELMRITAPKLGLSSLTRHESGFASIDKVYQHIDAVSARNLHRHPQLRAIYAYEDGAICSFHKAKERGLHRIYELPIGYWRTAKHILSEEAERQPDWAPTLRTLADSPAKQARKDEELRLANTIIVASQFTAQTLRDCPLEHPKPIVIPYGCPTPAASTPPPSPNNKPLRAIFIGSLTQRKGLADCLTAVAQAGVAIDLTLVGKRVADCTPLDQALNEHRWIESLPHSELLELLRQQDVLLFPSLFEGFGLVIPEALSQGVPVIASPHTCAPELIKDKHNGFIVPIRDSAAIASKLAWLSDNREALEEMRQQCLETARQHSWEHYRHTLVKVIQQELEA